MFGGVGAVVGAIAGPKQTKSVINSLKIKITVNDCQNPIVYIDLLYAGVKSNSTIYKKQCSIAQEIITFFALEEKRKEQTESLTTNELKSNAISAADEILKFKALLDSGAINQDEYEAKKKKLLDL